MSLAKMNRQKYDTNSILDKLADEFDKYLVMDRNKLMEKCIESKLNATLKKYNDELNRSLYFLENIADFRVIRSMNFMKKHEDRDVIKKYLIDEPKKGGK